MNRIMVKWTMGKTWWRKCTRNRPSQIGSNPNRYLINSLVLRNHIISKMTISIVTRLVFKIDHISNVKQMQIASTTAEEET